MSEAIAPIVKGEMRMSDEKTLWIKADKMEQIMRVIVENGHFCKVFYLGSEDGEDETD